ncbi:MAG: hypothetical protein MHM6MM_004046 [Cercozoa sp. M6MM]
MCKTKFNLFDVHELSVRYCRNKVDVPPLQHLISGWDVAKYRSLSSIRSVQEWLRHEQLASSSEWYERVLFSRHSELDPDESDDCELEDFHVANLVLETFRRDSSGEFLHRLLHKFTPTVSDVCAEGPITSLRRFASQFANAFAGQSTTEVPRLLADAYVSTASMRRVAGRSARN